MDSATLERAKYCVSVGWVKSIARVFVWTLCEDSVFDDTTRQWDILQIKKKKRRTDFIRDILQLFLAPADQKYVETSRCQL